MRERGGINLNVAQPVKCFHLAQRRFLLLEATTERLAEIIPVQQLGQIGQCVHMLSKFTLGHEEQDHEVDGFAVESVELNSFPRASNHYNHVTNQIGRCMRQPEAEPNARAHGGFTLFDARRDSVTMLGLDLVISDESGDQFVDGLPAVFRV